MLNKLIVIFASLFFIGFFHAYMRTRLVYKNKKEVEQIVTYINKFIAENYYKLPKHLSEDQEVLVISISVQLNSQLIKLGHAINVL